MALGSCRYCGEQLSWRQRSDAVYCSGKCRVAAHRAVRTEPVQLTQRSVLSAPLRRLYVEPDTDFYWTRWSSAVMCMNCGRFAKRAIEMRTLGAVDEAVFCSWRCIERAL